MVRKMESVTICIVNTKYLPNKGTTKLVGGIISRNGKKNSVNASRIEIHKVIFSPLLIDKQNTTIVRRPKLTHGIIKFIV